LKEFFDEFADEDLNIEYIEERLYTYSKLKRKHNLDTEGLIRKKDELKEKIRFFEDRDFVLGEKKKAVDELRNKAIDTAKEIHKIRSEKALQLEEEIIRQTDDLMLNNVNFKVRIEENELNSKGMDDVEFYISLNKGEDLKPLKNVASGGEISRLMLALKTVFSSLSDTSLLIFDEIDTGVSGRVALAIGQKMHDISTNIQVLTITHLAAVAACADKHYFIFKNDNNGYSNTSVKQLNRQEIIKELAMISSSDNSDTALKAAEELYNSAQESIGK
ncbi:MAG: DNA repair protein RecN, partial [Erysipelotrichaceae bacterium]|nr:DNA repair protein RecN [Erysipelotrichaceae bacterium]